MFLSHVGRTPGQALAWVFTDVWLLVPVLTLVASHVVRVGRTLRGAGEGAAAPSPKLQLAT